MNLSVRRRLLQSLESYERDVAAAQLRAERRRRAAWDRLAKLRGEQAELDLNLARLRRHCYCPLPPPALEITFRYETAPALDFGPSPAPSSGLTTGAQGNAHDAARRGIRKNREDLVAEKEQQ